MTSSSPGSGGWPIVCVRMIASTYTTENSNTIAHSNVRIPAISPCVVNIVTIVTIVNIVLIVLHFIVDVEIGDLDLLPSSKSMVRKDTKKNHDFAKSSL